MNLEKRIVAVEMALKAGEPPLPGFCPIQKEGETEAAFNARISEIRAANPGHKVIPFFVVDGRVPAGSEE